MFLFCGSKLWLQNPAAKDKWTGRKLAPNQLLQHIFRMETAHATIGYVTTEQTDYSKDVDPNYFDIIMFLESFL